MTSTPRLAGLQTWPRWCHSCSLVAAWDAVCCLWITCLFFPSPNSLNREPKLTLGITVGLQTYTIT